MRKIRELLRLKFEQRLSDRKIAVALSMSRSAVGECLHRAANAAVLWPLPDGLDDAELERLLYPLKPRPTEIPWPDFTHVHRELSRPGVTRQLLWEEYKAQHPQGLQYSAFCDRYREWLQSTVEPVMRFAHRAGEKCFVDYAGQRVGIIERRTGEIREAQIFVAVLGCSNYTFAEATWTQALRALITTPQTEPGEPRQLSLCTRTCAGRTTSTERQRRRKDVDRTDDPAVAATAPARHGRGPGTAARQRNAR